MNLRETASDLIYGAKLALKPSLLNSLMEIEFFQGYLHIGQFFY